MFGLEEGPTGPPNKDDDSKDEYLRPEGDFRGDRQGYVSFFFFPGPEWVVGFHNGQGLSRRSSGGPFVWLGVSEDKELGLRVWNGR